MESITPARESILGQLRVLTDYIPSHPGLMTDVGLNANDRRRLWQLLEQEALCLEVRFERSEYRLILVLYQTRLLQIVNDQKQVVAQLEPWLPEQESNREVRNIVEDVASNMLEEGPSRVQYVFLRIDL